MRTLDVDRNWLICSCDESGSCRKVESSDGSPDEVFDRRERLVVRCSSRCRTAASVPGAPGARRYRARIRPDRDGQGAPRLLPRLLCRRRDRAGAGGRIGDEPPQGAAIPALLRAGDHLGAAPWRCRPQQRYRVAYGTIDDRRPHRRTGGAQVRKLPFDLAASAGWPLARVHRRRRQHAGTSRVQSRLHEGAVRRTL